MHHIEDDETGSEEAWRETVRRTIARRREAQDILRRAGRPDLADDLDDDIRDLELMDRLEWLP